MKKFLTVLMVVSMLMSLSGTINAAVIPPENPVMPCWEYINSIDLDLNFYGTDGLASLTITRVAGVTTSLEATLTVYEKVGTEWVVVTSDSTSSSRSIFLEISFDAESGVTYKAEVSVTAYGPGGSETETTSDTETCP